jgi:hypothetical protein
MSTVRGMDGHGFRWTPASASQQLSAGLQGPFFAFIDF